MTNNQKWVNMCVFKFIFKTWKWIFEQLWYVRHLSGWRGNKQTATEYLWGFKVLCKYHVPSLKQCYRVHQRYSGQICAVTGALPRGVLFHTAVVHGPEESLSPLWECHLLVEEQPSQESAVERTPLSPRPELLLAHILGHLAGIFLSVSTLK